MNYLICITGLFGFLAVALGAFGAHALKEALIPADLEIFKTAAQYQMFHTLALFGAAILLRLEPSNRWFKRASVLFIAGIVIFSGSLYLLVATQARWWGAVTPLGGVSLMSAWIFLAV